MNAPDIRESRVDLAVVGGGMVGASLAVALADTGLAVTLVEAVPPETGRSPSFDGRTTALSNGSRRILTALGVWPPVAAAAAPIRRIHVSDRGQFGAARIDAAEQGLEAMGYVVPNRALGDALWSRLAGHPRIHLRSPCRATGLRQDAESATLDLDDGTTLSARLVVAADGAQSLVRTAAGLAAESTDYGQVAVITQVGCGRPHQGVAHERFTPAGPIAVLPLPDAARVATVWALPPDEAARVGALPEAAFLAELQAAFGWRLGRFTAAGERLAYPLALVEATDTVAGRVVAIGNAAQGLHPIAGQGFNLGLRDAVTLAECLVEGGADAGAPGVLERYVAWRREDRRLLIGFTDGLVRLFRMQASPVRAARGLGLLLFDLAPPAKAALSRLSTGGGGVLPRLARGLKLGPLAAPRVTSR